MQLTSYPQRASSPTQVMGLTGGGLSAAQHAQAMGRGGDSMLVHMSPGEVKGLQALAMAHGGSLTINPKTGLPEAGFLSSLLPVIAGAAITAMTGIPAWQVGLGIGGATALATGSLGKGLMAGLGAFGGAGLGGGLTAAGALGEAGSAANLASATDIAAQGTGQIGNAAYTAIPSELGGSYVSPVTSGGASYFVPETGAANLVSAGATPTGMAGLQAAGQGIMGLGNEAGRTAFMENVGGGSGLFKYGAPIASTMLAGMAPKPPALEKRKAYIRPQELQIANLSGQVTPYSIGDSSERRMLGYTYSPQPIYQAAQGGVIDPDYNMDVGGLAAFSDGYAAGGETGLEALAKKRKSLKGDPLYKFSQDRRDSSMQASIDQNFATGGLPPRFLSGGGDGMSDSIRANIDGKQEARLADGEFVVPADVVSHLGNGSSKAGAKKLYGMMDKIRKARTGKTRQAPEVNAAKYMPA